MSRPFQTTTEETGSDTTLQMRLLGHFEVRLQGVPLPDPIISFEGHNVIVDKEADITRTTDWANTVGRQLFGS